MRIRLRTLYQQGYIGRKYDTSHRQHSLPASYYLTPEAIRFLKKQPGLNHNVLNSAYRDKNANQEFIDHNLNLFAIYRLFKDFYGDKLHFFSKSELYSYNHFPKALSDAYLRLGDKELMLYVFEATTEYFMMRRKIKNFIEHNEEDIWRAATGNEYPNILIVCDISKLERRLQRYLTMTLEDKDIEAYTTTRKALLSSQSSNDAIWSNVEEPNKLLSLDQVLVT